MPSRLTVETWPITEPGQAGAENEDSVLVYQPPDLNQQRYTGNLYLVADGAGGGARGHLASQYVAQGVAAYYFGSDEPDLGLRLREAIERTNRDLFNYVQQRPELVKLSAVVAAAVVRGEAAHIAWVGDCRAYVIREGGIDQVTRDHTLVQQLLDEAAITPSEAREHPRRDVVLRSLGAEENVMVDVVDMRLRPDDVILLCSDGLVRLVSDEEIAEIVASNSPRLAVERLLQKAKDRGSKDDISIVASLLRDGAPPLVTEVPYTWNGRAPSLDRPEAQSGVAGSAVVGIPATSEQAQSAPLGSFPDWLGAPPQSASSPTMQTRTPTEPGAPTSPRGAQPDSLTRASDAKGWVEANAPYSDDDTMQAPAYRPTASPAHRFETQVRPAPGQPAAPQPYPREPFEQPSQLWADDPDLPPPPGRYPTQAGSNVQYGQRGVPRGYTPPPGYDIDPVTGLSPVPPDRGGYGAQGYGGPQIYQPPGYGGQRPQRQITVRAFALVGVLAVVLTAAIVFLLVNPFGWSMPFALSNGEQPAAASTATVDGASTTAPTPAVVTPVPTEAATAEPVDVGPVAPPGMVVIDEGPFRRGVPDEEIDASILSCISEDQSADNVLCLRDYFIDAQPVEDITLSTFFMDVTEVTNVAYAQCVAAEVCTPPQDQQFYSDPAFAQHPVTFVTWDQAVQYCQFAGKRLPTEAEWEKAARWDPQAGVSNTWPWGNTFTPGQANTALAGQNGTSAVSAFEQDISPFGVRGMAGNVSEWVQDWYFPSYEGFGTLNPSGPAAPPLTQEIHVARGGSFLDIAAYARSGHRLAVQTDSDANWLGIRCAASADGGASGGDPVPTQEPVETTPPAAESGETPTTEATP